MADTRQPLWADKIFYISFSGIPSRVSKTQGTEYPTMCNPFTWRNIPKTTKVLFALKFTDNGASTLTVKLFPEGEAVLAVLWRLRALSQLRRQQTKKTSKPRNFLEFRYVCHHGHRHKWRPMGKIGDLPNDWSQTCRWWKRWKLPMSPWRSWQSHIAAWAA